MRRITWFSLFVVMIVGSASVMAATMPSSITRDALTYSKNLDRLSVGFDYESIHRIMDPGGGDFELWGNAYSGYLGYDLLPSLTVFATLGTVESKIRDGSDYGSLQPKWSLGASSYLWRYDVDSPTFMSGRLSIRSSLELSRFDSDIDGQGDVEWYDLSIAMPFGFEIMEDNLNLRPHDRVSLNLWVGPMLSWIDGEYSRLGSKTTFDAKREFGGVAGLDLYMAPNLCLSAQTTVFDEVSVSGSVRYHF